MPRSADEHLARLIIDGYTVIPDMIVGDELEAMRAGFERRAAQTGKRWFDWDDIALVPELVAYLAHPRLMAVVDPFVTWFGHEAVFANSPGARDVYDPAKPPGPFDPTVLRDGPLGWHDDVQGMKNPNADILPTALASLLYLDETFAHSGAYCSAVGSCHLARATADKKPVIADREYVLEHCELRPIPVKPGTVILYRAHHWHGVIPPHQRRRLVLQGFTTRAHYNLQIGHTQLSDATLKLIPAERRRYLMWYTRT